ncbi:HNH endonuclease [Sphingomonas sp. DC1100-1]|uniref:HNH endonuclease n=1 Tax=unclassified Sphingomonas TaxID=196159 RepID=UPI003CE8D18C
MITADNIRAMLAAGLTAEQMLSVVEHYERIVAAQDAEEAAKPKARCRNAERRAALGLSDWEWRKLRARILARDGHRCAYCHSTGDLHCDHIIPLARGGTNDPDNLEAVCRICNTSKGAKTPEEWLR